MTGRVTGRVPGQVTGQDDPRSPDSADEEVGTDHTGALEQFSSADLARLHDVWMAAVCDEIDCLGRNISTSVQELSECIANLSASDVTEDGKYLVDKAKIFQLVQVLQFEDRMRQEITSIVAFLKSIDEIAGHILHQGEASAPAEDPLDALNDVLVRRLKTVVGLHDVRERIEQRLKTAFGA